MSCGFYTANGQFGFAQHSALQHPVSTAVTGKGQGALLKMGKSQVILI